MPFEFASIAVATANLGAISKTRNRDTKEGDMKRFAFLTAVMAVALLGTGCEQLCLTYTPGFWGTHPEITDMFLPIESCGITLDNIGAGADYSAIEDLCSSDLDADQCGLSPQRLQLIRQCTAAALNITATLSSENPIANCECAHKELASLMEECCVELCTSDATGQEISESTCIERLTDFNESEDTLEPFGPFIDPGPGAPETCEEAIGNGFVNPR